MVSFEKGIIYPLRYQILDDMLDRIEMAFVVKLAKNILILIRNIGITTKFEK